MVTINMFDQIISSLNKRKSKILTIAQVGMTEHQFKAFRALFLDEFGQEGFETDLKKCLNAGKHLDHKRNGQA